MKSQHLARTIISEAFDICHKVIHVTNLCNTGFPFSLSLLSIVCPSSVVVHECPTAVSTGDSATLGCRSAATSPPPVLYWLYDGARVENTSSEFRASVDEDGANVLTYTKQFDRTDFNKDFVCCIESTSMCSQLCSEPCRPDILCKKRILALYTVMCVYNIS